MAAAVATALHQSLLRAKRHHEEPVRPHPVLPYGIFIQAKKSRSTTKSFAPGHEALLLRRQKLRGTINRV